MSLKSKQNKMKKRPLHEVRLGAIRATVWRNETKTGARFNVKFSRIYKDGDTWKSADSFGRDDLLLISKVADLAHTRIHEQERAESRSQEPPAKPAVISPTH